MPEKPKGTEINAGTVDQQQTRRQQPGAHAAGRRASALDKSGNVDEGKLNENRARMGVGSDHKTPEMKKGRRGTFP